MFVEILFATAQIITVLTPLTMVVVVVITAVAAIMVILAVIIAEIETTGYIGIKKNAQL